MKKKMKIVDVMDKDLPRDSVHNTWSTCFPELQMHAPQKDEQITLPLPFSFNVFGFYYFQYDSCGNT